ncbi:MAG: galactose ABC transporter substrate-binding protein [Faecousia sp.]
MKMKKALALVLALVLVLALAACAKGNTNSKGDAAGKKVGICIYKFDDNFMTTYRNALESDLKAKGYEVSVVDGKNDQATQTEQINTFISQKYDILIINPVMTSAADGIVEQVKAAGIPAVIINREPTAEVMNMWDKIAYVGCDAAQSGTYQGELILETANKGDINGDGVISYIMIQGDPENIDAQLRTQYSVKALEDAGMKVEQLNLTRGDWDQAKGQEICANDLAQFGDKVEVVFCNNDAMALGAQQAIQAANRTVGKDIYLVGVDALPDALEQVKAGTMTGTVLNDAKGQAAKAIEVMEMLLKGETVEKQYYVDYVKVTPENVADFMG